MQRVIPFALFLSMFFVATPVHAEEVVVCADIESAIERLDCYDRQHREREARRAARTETAARPVVTPRVPPRPRPTYQTNRTEPAPPPPPTVTALPEAEPRASAPAEASPPPVKKGGLFSWNRKVEIESAIAALRRGEKQRMVFRLENGQIWMQNTPRDLPFSVGDSVTIKSGRLGGFVMRSDGGTSTRVRPLE